MMRRSSSRALLSLGVAMLAALSALVPAPACAQSAFTTRVSSALVPLVGVVVGGAESVSFSGQAQIKSNVVTDPDFGSVPTVVLTIDMGGVTGSGALTGGQYLSTDREILTRRLAAGDTVQYTFPFYLSGTSPTSSAHLGRASFNLSFDVNTMQLVGATGRIDTP